AYILHNAHLMQGEISICNIKKIRLEAKRELLLGVDCRTMGVLDYSEYIKKSQNYTKVYKNVGLEAYFK
ncbi:MAG: hypothetical protein ACT6FD_06495, partial [Methanosarcinaceae archaeon]